MQEITDIGGQNMNRTGAGEAEPYGLLEPVGRAIVTVSYVIGVIGSGLALYILHKQSTRYKNKKHYIMLKCLVGSDLVALLGMLVQMYVRLYLPKEMSSSYWRCVFRVIWRWFGLGSGCVAIVMAVERWLALTHPFFYHKNVTHQSVLKAILILWTATAVLVCLPFMGFGLFFDKKDGKGRCKRYRLATEPADVAYAYLYFTFGMLICIIIACANFSVIRTLCDPLRLHDGRRIHSLKRQQSTRIERINVSTPDEVAFVRLMLVLSVSCLVCWLPQLLAIPMAQFHLLNPEGSLFSNAADTLMAIHFMLDPFIYVLLHHYFPCINLTFQLVPRLCCCCCPDKSDDYVMAFSQDVQTSDKDTDTYPEKCLMRNGRG